MKKIVAINTILTGSTGGIMRGICNKAEQNGMQTWTATSYQRKKPYIPYSERDIVIGDFFSLYSHLLFGKMTGLKGCFSVFSTIKLIHQLRKIQPNIIHIHNLHDSYINIFILFHYIKRNNIKTIWTLHDCWAFTGRCPYFDFMACSKWKKGCSKCKYPKGAYPTANVDATRIMWRVKKSVFGGVKDLTIVTPSEWLSNITKQSFLKEYPIMVINNGIDLNIFKPTDSSFRQDYNIGNKKIILGVALGWENRKGIDVMIRLAKELKSEYKIVLVGTTDEIDKNLPTDILSIHKTENQVELAKIYSAADVFVNPTREDNYPTVNLEAIACGTPVVTFNAGGSSEMVDDGCGITVDVDDIDSLKQAVISLSNKNKKTSGICLEHSRKFDKNVLFQKYIDLYK